MGLTNKQRLFIEHYLQCWNASEAARQAGYAEGSAAVAGTRLLTNANVAAEIKARIDAKTMSANESLVRLAEQARAAYADYILQDGSVDLAAMRRDGKMHLVKAIKYARNGDMMVEFHDAQAALFKVLQVHGLPVERVEATVEVEDARERVRSRVDSIAARLRERVNPGGTDAGPGSGGAT